jgi:nicotinamidase/pyrazinamidase
MVDTEHSVLLLVDIQPDFMPGGALAVDGGDRILEPLYHLMESSLFKHYVATQDWHPTGHISFASSHPGRKPMEEISLYGHAQTLWPDHCVQGSLGARLHPDLRWDRVNAIVRKGNDPKVDSYSGFRNNWNADGERPPTGLGGFLKERELQTVFIAGLARDVCVRYSALDAADTGFETYLLWDLSRPVDSSTDDAVRKELVEKGVHVIQSAQLQAQFRQ